MAADVALLETLRASLRTHCRHLVVFHDELEVVDDEHTTFARVTTEAQPYFQRWISALQWLRAHPAVRWVWCVDGTDVEMLHDPFPHMQPGRLVYGPQINTVFRSYTHNEFSLVGS
jgi:hypothetical protein